MAVEHKAVSGVIDASPAIVYAILSDYQNTHPQILPKPYFTYLTVEKGGQGAGTVVRTQVQMMGVKTDYHLVVTEPEPGRVLAERDEKLGVYTTFTVEPLEGGRKTHLTIASDWTPKPGIMGWLERISMPIAMQKLYTEEIERVRQFVKQQQTAGGGSGGFA
jgi:hypothetical protein